MNYRVMKFPVCLRSIFEQFLGNTGKRKCIENDANITENCRKVLQLLLSLQIAKLCIMIEMNLSNYLSSCGFNCVDHGKRVQMLLFLGCFGIFNL